MDASLAIVLDELLDTITTWWPGMPVRAMEKVLALGESAVPAVSDALARWRSEPERNTLWLIVLLGELRTAAAVPALTQELADDEVDSSAMVAAEALAKIGPPAVPALCAALSTGSEWARLHAYGALGWIPDQRAYAALLDALRADPRLANSIALALGDQGQRAAIPALYDAYQRCEPWQRTDIEETIRDLHRGVVAEALWKADWRLRYRARPEAGGMDPGWLGIKSILQAMDVRECPAPPLRTLEEIVATPAEAEEPATCPDCGAPIELPTGLPVCPETVVGMAALQLEALAGLRTRKFDDLFEVLDVIEARQWEAEDEADDDDDALIIDEDASEEDDSGENDAEAEDAAGAEDELIRATCEWCIAHGAEHIGAARALLLAELSRLAARYGDPNGVLRELTAAPRVRPKIGRNDPCPCGSGKKYKRCCL